MRFRSLLACLLAVLMVFSLIPIVQVQADSDWSSQYESFVLNQEYLQSGLNFNSDAYTQPRFGLFDLDQNGVPELFAYNGGPSLAASTDYVFTYESWGVNYIGNVGYRGCELYYYEGSTYSGLFCSDGNNGVLRTTYYELRDGNITSRDIQEIGANLDSTQRILPFFTIDEIRNMGWDAFVQETIGTIKTNEPENSASTSSAPYVPTVTASDNSWYSAYESFVLNQEYLASDWNSILKFSADVVPRFSLYDLDNNGTPELIAEGGPSSSQLQGHVISCHDGRLNYCGAITCNPYHYGDSAYPGLFTTEQLVDEYQVTYYTLVDGTLAVNAVRTFKPTEAGYNTSKALSYDQDLYAWSLAGQRSSLVFCSFSEIRVAGWQRFVIDTLWDSINLTIGTVCPMSPEQQYAANLYLSNFSEQDRFESYAHRFDANDWHLDDLVFFAYLYCKINKRDFLRTAETDSGYFYTLTLDNANTVWSRHFGFTLDDATAANFPQKPSVDPRYSSYYSNGVFYFPAADGERYNDFTVVRQMEQLEDGSFRMVFDIYQPDLNEYWNAGEAGDVFYRLTPEAAAFDSRITCEASGVAIVWPYVNNGNATYQLFRYAVSEIEPVPIINDEERTVEYEGYSTEFGPAELIVDSTNGTTNRNLTSLCALLSEAAYSPGGTDLIRVYQQMFGEGGFDSEFQYQNQVFCFGIAMSKMKIADADVDTNILFVTIKGTSVDGTLNLSEVGADLDDRTTDRLGYNAFQSVVDFEEKIQSRIDILLERHPEYRSAPLKIVITGHSLGGATANLLAAILTKRIEEDASWSAVTRKESIFCYTFGAIDSISIHEDNRDYPITSGYENIHNIYNLYDTFGPEQWKVGKPPMCSGKGKFGHLDLFKWEFREGFDFDVKKNHMMSSYIKAVTKPSVPEQGETNNRAWIRCPVDVEIFENGVLIGSVHENTVELLSDEIGISAYEDAKMIIYPSDRNFSLQLTAIDDGSMEYSVESFSSDSVEVKTFSNVALTKGKTMYSELNAGAPVTEVRLQVLEGDNTPAMDIHPDGTESTIQEGIASTQTEAIMQESGASALPEATKLWLIVAVAGLSVGIICLVILLTTRRKKSSPKSAKKAPSRHTKEEMKLPAFSRTRCCVCGHRLDEDDYRVFFHTKDGQEARLDATCYKQLYILRKSEDLQEIREAQRYIRSRYDAVDPIVADQLQKFVKLADDYLSGN